MTSQYWWSEPLRRFATDIEATCEVERYVTTISRRAPGDWWRNESRWCVHLDDMHYAEFEESDIDVRLQRTFTWAIQMMAEMRPPSWKEQLVGWVDSLSQRPLHELFLAGWDLDKSPTPEKLPNAFPGYVVWLHVAQASNVEQHPREDVRQVVSEVLDAYAPNSLAGWIETPHTMSAVLFLSVETNQDAFESNAAPFTTESELLRETLKELVEMVATDALVSCEIAVGAPVESNHSLYLGAATAVSAWREREFLPHTAKVTSWTQQPLAHLISGMSDDACRTFVRIASVRSPGGDVTLAPDLMEALYGVVAANLNVSEAARLLYLHRNTLINRIERVKQETGYDIRNFTDALTLWTVGAIQKRLQAGWDR